MQRLTFLLSVLFIAAIPSDDVIEIPGFGTLVKLLGILLSVTWIAQKLVEGRLRRLDNSHIMFALFTFWVTLSTFWSINQVETLKDVNRYVQLLLVTLIIWDLYRTDYRLGVGIQAFVLGTSISLASLFLNFVRGASNFNSRYGASDLSVNNTGGVYALTLLLVWILVSSPRFKEKFRRWRPLNYAFIPIAFTGIMLTGSRISTLMASFVGLTMLYSLRKNLRIIVTWLPLIILAALVSFQTIVPERSAERALSAFSSVFDSLVAGKDESNGRFDRWRDGWNTFVQHPITGTGSGTFHESNVLGKGAHNVAVGVSSELGLVGLFLFYSIIWCVFLRAKKQNRFEAELWVCLILLWMLGTVTSSWQLKKFTWIIMSFATASGALNQEEPEVDVPDSLASRGG